jgi:hypothetical protein
MFGGIPRIIEMANRLRDRRNDSAVYTHARPKEVETMSVAARKRKLLINTTIFAVSVTVSLLLAEFVSRIVVPLFPGSQKLSLSGEPIQIDWVKPGAVYRQHSNEYDALTTITDKGYRFPQVIRDPEVVFTGDSFTFGQGLSDDETFASIYCRALKISCTNLGVPGFSTISAIDRLEYYLSKEHWAPEQVFLFIMAMTGFLSAGNDLFDNWSQSANVPKNSVTATTKARAKPEEIGEPSNLLARTQTALLKHSNLVRLAKFYFGPAIKQRLAPQPAKQVLDEALAVTGMQLRRLDQMAGLYGFDYHIILIHPVQDILRGTDKETLSALQQIAPKAIVPTADALRDDPAKYYFRFDGHLNPAGSERMAKLLLDTFKIVESNSHPPK